MADELTRDELLLRLNKAEAFIAREGYRTCSAAACNCNSWHGGSWYGRYEEIREVAIEAGVKTNGVLLVDAIRDALNTRAAPAPSEPMETAGPYEARVVSDGMPADPLRYGIVSLSEGREVCRVWREQDARAITAALRAAKEKEHG